MIVLTTKVIDGIVITAVDDCFLGVSCLFDGWHADIGLFEFLFKTASSGTTVMLEIGTAATSNIEVIGLR